MQPRRGKYQFGDVSSITAEAVGKPGQRRFRLVLNAGTASAVLWLEKEQLSQLATYVLEVIESLTEAQKARDGLPPERTWDGPQEHVEFTVGRMAVGHDSSSNSFLFLAHDVEDEAQQEEAATLTFWVTKKMAEALAKQALLVCAAGRPRCFLCGLPINPEGHACPRSNGHLGAQA